MLRPALMRRFRSRAVGGVNMRVESEKEKRGEKIQREEEGMMEGGVEREYRKKRIGRDRVTSNNKK